MCMESVLRSLKCLELLSSGWMRHHGLKNDNHIGGLKKSSHGNSFNTRGPMVL